MAKKKTESKTLPRKIVYALAAKWDVDFRTIVAWIKNEDAMLTHPDSIAIIKGEKQLA